MRSAPANDVVAPLAPPAGQSAGSLLRPTPCNPGGPHYIGDMAAAPYIMALGDSLTAGYGLATSASFPAQLEQRLCARWPTAVVRNAGASGDTTEAALRRLPTLLTSLTQRPDLAIVELGANDVLRGVLPDRVAANLDAIVIELIRCGITPMLATFEPPPFVDRRYATVYAAVAVRHGLATAPFFPPDVLGKREFLLADGFHPNALAIEQVAAAFAPAVIAAILAQAADAT